MKIAIVGSGGVGGYYGARLAEAGHGVCFIARGAHAAAMRENGLRIESPIRPIAIDPVTVAETADGPFDLVIVAVKLWQTADLGDLLRRLSGTLVLSLQNGVDKDDMLAAEIGEAPLLGGVTYINAFIEAPGVIRQLGKLQRIIIGDPSQRSRATAIVQVFADAGIEAEESADIRRAIWEKFIFLSAYSGVTALIRLPIGTIREHPLTRKFLKDAMEETAAVARAAGIAIEENFATQRLAFIDTLPAEASASMAGDLARGNRLELEWLSGAVVRWGERFKVPTPVHQAIEAGLVLHARGSDRKLSG